MFKPAAPFFPAAATAAPVAAPAVPKANQFASLAAFAVAPPAPVPPSAPIAPPVRLPPSPFNAIASINVAPTTSYETPFSSSASVSDLPEVDYFLAPPEVLRGLFSRLNAAMAASTSERDVLRELHTYLASNPTLEPMILPDDMRAITATMRKLTGGQHHIATQKIAINAAAAEAKNAKGTSRSGKAAIVNELENALGGVTFSIGG